MMFPLHSQTAKTLVAGCSKRSKAEARETSILRLGSGLAPCPLLFAPGALQAVRCSEEIERNEVSGSFSAAC
jgi:hypothetical protein